MKNRLRKKFDFVHYFLREGGCLYCVPFFTIYCGRGGPKGNSAKFIIFTVFFLKASLSCGPVCEGLYSRVKIISYTIKTIPH